MTQAQWKVKTSSVSKDSATHKMWTTQITINIDYHFYWIRFAISSENPKEPKIRTSEVFSFFSENKNNKPMFLKPISTGLMHSFASFTHNYNPRTTGTETFGEHNPPHAPLPGPLMYSVSQKKQDVILLFTTSPIVDRFSKFFQQHTQQ